MEPNEATEIYQDDSLMGGRRSILRNTTKDKDARPAVGVGDRDRILAMCSIHSTGRGEILVAFLAT